MQKLKHIEFANVILSNINVNIVETYSCLYTGNRMSHFSRVLMFEPFMLHWGEHPCILLSKCRIFLFLLIVPEPLSGGIHSARFEFRSVLHCIVPYCLYAPRYCSAVFWENVSGLAMVFCWARWARRQFGAVGQSCCMKFLEGDLVGFLSRSSRSPDFLEVLARRSCGYPSEILCCRGVCEEILRTSCWNPLKDICVKI